MTETILTKTFEIEGSELKRMFRERREFETARRTESGQRLEFMAHADGYVMARPTESFPIVVSEGDWRAMPLSP